MMMLILLQLTSVNRRDRMIRLFNYYLSGKDNIVSTLNDERSLFVACNEGHLYDYCKYFHKKFNKSFFIKNTFPTCPLKGTDLPRSNTELNQYYNWLCKIQGCKTLVDAWNNPIKFYIKGHTIFIQSAGPDKIAGTADDIIVSKKIDESAITTAHHLGQQHIH